MDICAGRSDRQDHLRLEDPGGEAVAQTLHASPSSGFRSEPSMGDGAGRGEPETRARAPAGDEWRCSRGHPAAATANDVCGYWTHWWRGGGWRHDGVFAGACASKEALTI